MHYFIGAIIIVILSSVIFSIAKKKAGQIEKEMDPNDFIIRQPKTSLKLYIFVTVFFFLIYGFTLLGETDGGGSIAEKWWIYLLALLPFMALGPFLIVLWHRWKIAVKGNQITACSYFGKEKSFTFDYITTVKSGVNFTKMGKIDYIIAYHEKKKLFSLSAICPGYQVLVSRLKDGGHSFV
jgi:uncharacterized membrane protein YhaH (DUF805 family)